MDFKLKNSFLRQILSFIVVGGICYMVSVILLVLSVEVLQMEVNLANLITSLITIFVCYVLNVNFVFVGGRHSKKKEVMTFFSFSILGLALNVILMYLMTTYLPIWYVISKTIIVAIVSVFNFVVRKNFVFLK